MIKIIIIIIALMAGLTLGPELSANKGYILLSIDGYTTYETTIINAVLIALVFYFLLLLVEKVLRKLLSMNSFSRQWISSRKNKKAQKYNVQGMLALFEGNDKQAHKLLEKSAPKCDSPALTYIAAAKAAHNQGKYEQRDELFQHAYQQNGAQLATGLTWAELQIDAQQYQEAYQTLSELEKKYPKKMRISELYLVVYPELNQWQKYIDLLNQKSRIFVFSDDQLTQRFETGYRHLFEEKAQQGGDVLQLFWTKKVPRWMRKSLNYQKLLLEVQIQAGNDTFAEPLLLDILKKHFNRDFLHYIDKLQLVDYTNFITLLEGKLADQSESGLIHQLIAHLQLKESKPELAIKHLEESIKTLPNVKDFALLADLLQKEERVDEANQYYRQGLSFASSQL